MEDAPNIPPVRGGDPAAAQKSDPSVPPRRSGWRRFRWPIVLGAILIVLLLLLLLAPSIASSGWVRSIVVGKINQSINGRVQIDDWSLSWRGGTQVSGVRLFQNEAQILEMKKLSTDLGVWGALFGKGYALGKIRVEGLDFVLRVYSDGSTNFQKLVKTPSESKTVIVPDLTGDLDADFRGTVTQERSGAPAQVVNIDPSTLKASISDINQPIQHQLQMAARVGSAPPGTITAGGGLKLFEKNELSPQALHVDEIIELKSLELASLLPMVGASGIDQLRGLTNGKFIVKADGLERVTAEGSAVSTNFAAGGPVLKGDLFTTPQLSVVIPQTSFSKANDLIRTGPEGKPEPITIQFAQGALRLAIDASRQALLNFAANNKPGAAGSLVAGADLDLGALARDLPHMLALDTQTRLDSGRLHQELNVTLVADKAILKQQLDITDIKGNRDGRAIAPAPIHITLTGSTFGGGWAVPDLRDFSLALLSGFAQINGKGESLGQLSIDGNVDLEKLRQELSFIDFGRTQMQGQAKFALKTSGEPGRADSPSVVDASLTATNIRVAGVRGMQEELVQPRLMAEAKAKLNFDKNSGLRSIDGAVITAQAGSATSPTLDAQLAGSVNFATPSGGAASTQPARQITVPQFEIARLAINLAKAQEEFAPVVPAWTEAGYALREGTLEAKGSGSYDGTTATFKSFDVNLRDVTLLRENEPLLQRENVALNLAGTMATAKDAIAATISKLDLKTSFASALIEDLGLRLPQGSVGASGLQVLQRGRVSVDVPDLAKVAALIQPPGDEAAQSVPAAPQAPAAAPAPAPTSAKRAAAAARRRAAAEEAADEPLPPIRVRSGSLKLAANVQQSDRGTSINVDQISGRNIAFTRGEGDFKAQDIALKLAALIGPAAAGSQSLGDIQITDLGGETGIGRVSLQEPIIIRQPGGAMTASGAIRFEGELRNLTDLMAALEGLKRGSRYPYAGKLAVEQKLTTENQTVTATGQVRVADFTVTSAKGPGFTEKELRLTNSVLLDQKANILNLKNLAVSMASSNAVGLSMQGRVEDLQKQRRLQEMRLLLSYDAAKLLEILRPMLSPDQQTQLESLKVTGVVKDRAFDISGSYPVADADRTGKQRDPLRSLRVAGSLAFDRIEFEKMATEERMELPIVLADGTAALVDPSKPKGQYPPPVKFSGGKLDLGGLEVLIVGKSPRLSSPRQNQALLEKVQASREFLKNYLGSANPLFTTAVDAKGVISVTINELSRLPLGDALVKPSKKEDGKASITVSLTDLSLQGGMLQLLSSQLKLGSGKDLQLGEIKQAKFDIEDGMVRSNMEMTLAGHNLSFRNGVVRLRNQEIVSMSMLLPKELLPVVRDQKFVQPVIEVPITGTLSRPNFDIAKAAVKSVVPSNPADLLKGFGLEGSDQKNAGEKPKGGKQPAKDR